MTDDLHATPSKALDEGRLQPVDKEEVVTLKPCPNPWCVSTSRPLPAFASRSETWSVICGCGVRSFGRDTEAEAIAAWNTRQSETGAALPSDGGRLGPYLLTITRMENYSGEHREWTETVTIPVGHPLIKQIVSDALAQPVEAGEVGT